MSIYCLLDRRRRFAAQKDKETICMSLVLSDLNNQSYVAELQIITYLQSALLCCCLELRSQQQGGCCFTWIKDFQDR